MIESSDLEIRYFIYSHFVEESLPPTTAETAAHFNLQEDGVAQIYRRLHKRHYIFLQPGTTQIRMANPLSAVPTAFVVHVGPKSYFANCAWDMLGVPAMLHEDALIEATYSGSGETLRMQVDGGQIKNGQGLVHFPLPVWRWYDDLIHT